MKVKFALDYRAKSVKLYREDLESIVKIVADTCKTIKIESGKCEYDSLNDLEEHAGTQVKELLISGYGPTLDVYLWRGLFGAQVVTREKAAEAGFLKIKEILRDRQRLVSKLPGLKFWTAVVIASVLAGVIMDLPSIVLPVVLFALLFGTLSFAGEAGLFNSIKLYRKRERGLVHFWATNRNSLILIVITAIITLLVSRLGDSLWAWIVSKIGNTPN